MPMPIQGNIEVRSSGYAFHTKPFTVPYIEHMKNFLFRIQTEGYSRALVDGKLELIGPGDLLIYGPNEAYELVIDASSNPHGEQEVLSGDYYIFIRGSWTEAWWKQKKRPQKIRTSIHDGIVTLFRQIVAEQRKTSQYSEAILEHYMKILCLSINRAASVNPGQGHAFIAYGMKNFIEEAATRPFKLEEVAEHAGVSVSRAVHLFKQVFNQSIMQYAMEVRLNMARERVLFSPLPLHYVAETSGFANYTYFFRVFRKRFGLSPSEFRQAYSDFRQPTEA